MDVNLGGIEMTFSAMKVPSIFTLHLDTVRLDGPMLRVSTLATSDISQAVHRRETGGLLVDGQLVERDLTSKSLG